MAHPRNPRRLLLLAVLLLPGSLLATDFYVATNGTTSTAGGHRHPLESVEPPDGPQPAFRRQAGGHDLAARRNVHGPRLERAHGDVRGPDQGAAVSGGARAPRRRPRTSPRDADRRRPVHVVLGLRGLLVGAEPALVAGRLVADGPQPRLLYRHRAGRRARRHPAHQPRPARRDRRDRELPVASGRRDLRQPHLQQRLERGDGPGTRERDVRPEPDRDEEGLRQHHPEPVRRRHADLRVVGRLSRQHSGHGQHDLLERLALFVRLRPELPLRGRSHRDERDDGLELLLLPGLARRLYVRRIQHRVRRRGVGLHGPEQLVRERGRRDLVVLLRLDHGPHDDGEPLSSGHFWRRLAGALTRRTRTTGRRSRPGRSPTCGRTRTSRAARTSRSSIGTRRRRSRST